MSTQHQKEQILTIPEIVNYQRSFERYKGAVQICA